MAKADVKKMEFRNTMVSYKDIIVDPEHNARNFKLSDNKQSIEEMKADIKLAGGVLEPILIRVDDNKKLILMDGERRLRAIKELNEEKDPDIGPMVPIRRVEAKSEAEQLQLSLSANTGKPFHQFEFGDAFKRFIRMGWTTEQISARFQKTERFIRDAIELADGSQAVLESLAKGEITVMVALRIIRNNEAAVDQKEAVKEVTEKRAAEGKTKGPAKAAYNKRNLNIKVPTPEFKKLVKFFAQFDDPEFTKWYAVLSAYLPHSEKDKDTKKGAAKELAEF